MDFKLIQREGAQVLVVNCNLDEPRARQLEEHLENCIDGLRGNLYIDMEGVNSLSSEAFKVLRRFNERISGGQLILLGVKQEVLRVTLRKSGLRLEDSILSADPEMRIVVEGREFLGRAGDLVGRTGTNQDLSRFLRELSKRNEYYAEFSREHFRLNYREGRWRLQLSNKGPRPRNEGDPPYPYYEKWGINTTWLDGKEVTPEHEYPLPGPQHRITVSQKVTIILDVSARTSTARAMADTARRVQ
jgi:anti-anti-sigma factor